MEKVGTEIINVKNLLAEQIYTLGYFQRGYKWESSHINDLVNDLVGEFRSHQANEVSKTSVYFLGSIIVSGKGREFSLVDGQQRLTSLSLILLWIAREYEQIKDDILPLIFKENDGKKICTLNVKERTNIMDALYDEERTDTESISGKNIMDRFDDIDQNFRNKKIDENEILEFTEWLLNNVCVVQIKTKSEKDAYKIFETANDRGVKLTSVDIFKGYVLSNVTPDNNKIRLDGIWKEKMKDIKNAGESDTAAIKAWLRASQAENTIDFDNIGKEFHRWIKTKVKERDTKLKHSKDFENLISIDFQFYIKWYLYLNKIAKGHDFNPRNESIYCNQLYQYTFQHVIILTAIDSLDNEELILKKIELVSTFIDIFIAQRLWNGKPVRQTTLEKPMRFVVESIKGMNINKMLSFFLDLLNQQDEQIGMYTSPHVKLAKRIFLARFSAWLDTQIGGSNARLPEYTNTRKYDIEHIIPNKYEYYEDIADEFKEEAFLDEEEFSAYRDMFATLILLPKSLNRSYGDAPYEDKLKEYIKHDMILAKTLCEENYNKNPAINRVNDEFKIGFEPHDIFLKNGIAKRQKVYARLAKIIWSPERLKDIVER